MWKSIERKQRVLILWNTVYRSQYLQTRHQVKALHVSTGDVPLITF